MAARLPAFSRTAYLLTGDLHLAEDLVQTALFKAAKAWHRIEGDHEAWVRRILYTQSYEDLAEVETARVLGIGVGTVKSQTRQALARLRAVAPHLGELMRTEAPR